MIRDHNYKKHLWFTGALIGALLVILCFGCDRKPDSVSQKTAVTTYSDTQLRTVEHDGCEYVVMIGSYKGGLVHKQNCKFCAERNKNEALSRTSTK